jgi:hypothetical protein
MSHVWRLFRPEQKGAVARNIDADTALPAQQGVKAMRMSTAYFAGAGTVVIAVAIGLGGGLLMAEMMNPRVPTDTARLERRTAPQPAPTPAPSAVANSVTSASTSSYLAATQAAARTPVVVKPAGDGQPNPQAIAEPPQPSPVTAAAAVPTQTAVAEPASAPAAANMSQQQASPPEAAYAKASDADLKSSDGKSRDTDSRRAERERRRTERRQQWAEHRRQRRDLDTRPDMRAVEQAVREDTEARPAYVVERVGPTTPRFNLFDEND